MIVIQPIICQTYRPYLDQAKGLFFLLSIVNVADNHVYFVLLKHLEVF